MNQYQCCFNGCKRIVEAQHPQRCNHGNAEVEMRLMRVIRTSKIDDTRPRPWSKRSEKFVKADADLD